MMQTWRLLGITFATTLIVGLGVQANLGPALADWTRIGTPRLQDVPGEQDRLYRSLVVSLPASGRIGYLLPADWPDSVAVARFYLASYALTPRLIVLGTDPEFVIVTPEASIPGDQDPSSLTSTDPRLAGFVLVRRFDNGVRIFRRQP
jgi:hypothetical protein